MVTYSHQNGQELNITGKAVNSVFFMALLLINTRLIFKGTRIPGWIRRSRLCLKISLGSVGIFLAIFPYSVSLLDDFRKIGHTHCIPSVANSLMYHLAPFIFGMALVTLGIDILVRRHLLERHLLLFRTVASLNDNNSQIRNRRLSEIPYEEPTPNVASRLSLVATPWFLTVVLALPLMLSEIDWRDCYLMRNNVLKIFLVCNVLPPWCAFLFSLRVFSKVKKPIPPSAGTMGTPDDNNSNRSTSASASALDGGYSNSALSYLSEVSWEIRPDLGEIGWSTPSHLDYFSYPHQQNTGHQPLSRHDNRQSRVRADQTEQRGRNPHLYHQTSGHSHLHHEEHLRRPQHHHHHQQQQQQQGQEQNRPEVANHQAHRHPWEEAQHHRPEVASPQAHRHPWEEAQQYRPEVTHHQAHRHPWEVQAANHIQEEDEQRLLPSSANDDSSTSTDDQHSELRLLVSQSKTLVMSSALVALTSSLWSGYTLYEIFSHLKEESLVRLVISTASFYISQLIPVVVPLVWMCRFKVD